MRGSELDRRSNRSVGSDLDGRRYSDELSSGWVVENRYEMEPKNPPPGVTTVESLCFWYGPDHGFGTGFGGGTQLGYSVAVFDSKVKADLALKRAGIRGRRGLKVVDLRTARVDAARYAVDVADRSLSRAIWTRAAAVAQLESALDAQNPRKPAQIASEPPEVEA